MISKKLIETYLKNRYGAIKLKKIEELGEGVHGIGYLVEFELEGEKKRLILKTLFPRDFGHDHFSDRAQVLLLANHAYNLLPKHVRSIDVVGISEESVVSIGEAKEFFILMEEAHGESYFDDLEKIKKRGYLEDNDKLRAKKLSDYLVEIHKQKFDDGILYKRRIRDVVGHGECLMGVLDTYPKVDFTSDEEIGEIAAKSARWWSKIREKKHRLCVVHGDYHPGNIWWNDRDFILLDRSRGIYGEPGDDVSCLSINYLFYALQQKNDFIGPFKELFYIFFENYLEKTKDEEMLEVLAPFYAFRVAVVANPIFYPNVTDEVRRKMFNFAHGVLDDKEFEIDKINEYIKAK